MSILKPFKGIRPKIELAEKVASRPYDVLNSAEAKKFQVELLRYIDYLMPKFVDERKSNLTISIGCTGGKHRSVVMADVLRKHLKENRYSVRVNHRDIYK